MESRVKVLGHPAHQIMVMFPIGALGLSVVSDALHTLKGRRLYASTARLALDYGLVTAAAAAPFGVIDWLGIGRRTRAKRVGALHAVGNLAVLGLFAASRLLRTGERAPAPAKWLSGAGLALSGATAWLGGELVNRHGIGVSDVIGQDLPSSLTPVQERPIITAPVLEGASATAAPASLEHADPARR